MVARLRRGGVQFPSAAHRADRVACADLTRTNNGTSSINHGCVRNGQPAIKARYGGGHTSDSHAELECHRCQAPVTRAYVAPSVITERLQAAGVHCGESVRLRRAKRRILGQFAMSRHAEVGGVHAQTVHTAVELKRPKDMAGKGPPTVRDQRLVDLRIDHPVSALSGKPGLNAGDALAKS